MAYSSNGEISSTSTERPISNVRFSLRSSNSFEYPWGTGNSPWRPFCLARLRGPLEGQRPVLLVLLPSRFACLFSFFFLFFPRLDELQIYKLNNLINCCRSDTDLRDVTRQGDHVIFCIVDWFPSTQSEPLIWLQTSHKEVSQGIASYSIY